jgi:hypothetical protein
MSALRTLPPRFARAEVEGQCSYYWRRAAPTLIAGTLALVYVLVSPPSLDLAAHMFRAWLFSSDPFGIWNNYWYAGHHTVGYSLLYPAAAAALTPQIAAGLAATGTAALFEPLAHRHFGRDAWLGAALFGAATATDLFTGRLAFAFGALPAMAAVLALDRDRLWLASGLGILTALCSPVDALFAGLAGAAYAIGVYAMRRELRPALGGAALAVASVAPVALLAVAFPEGGTEPFAFSALWPIPLIAAAMLVAAPRDALVLRCGIAIYTLGTIASYVIATPLGSNAARLGTFLALPLAALLLWRRRSGVWLAVLAAPLLYLEWQAPIRDLITASGERSNSSGYYQPLLSFLERQSGPPFRVEIPFTSFHWEAYAVAQHFPIARGWERQLDIKDNSLFYSGNLTAARYEAWLHRNAVRFVAVSDAQLDYSGVAEKRLISSGLAYLKPVLNAAHWRVYEVRDATPIAQGTATLRSLGPDWLRLDARRPGNTLVRVHFTPYWSLAKGSGCVAPAGDYTELMLRRPGPVRLVISFSLGRIGARSPRCT